LAQGNASSSVYVAAKLGVPVARVVAHPERGAGTFSIEFADAESVSTSPTADFANPDDVALVLHTSGTTSRPKIVPLKQRNVCASARNVRQTLALTTDGGKQLADVVKARMEAFTSTPSPDISLEPVGALRVAFDRGGAPTSLTGKFRILRGGVDGAVMGRYQLRLRRAR
jgi:non-ribosomal peptide synthetase component F